MTQAEQQQNYSKLLKKRAGKEQLYECYKKNCGIWRFYT